MTNNGYFHDGRESNDFEKDNMVKRQQQGKITVRPLGTEPSEITDAESKLIEAAARGSVCDLGDGKANQGEKWGPERTVRASVIYALCIGLHQDWPVHAKGVRLKGAKIEGMLDFKDATLQYPLYLMSCFIVEPMCFDDAYGRTLAFTQSYTHGFTAEGLVTTGSVYLDLGFTAKGEVRLLRAKVGSILACRGGTFENPKGNALSADGLSCKGAVFLDQGFTAKGEVRLLGAEVGGNLSCRGGTFENPKGNALSADGLDCKGDVSLDQGFAAKGVVRLPGAKIGGDLVCSGGTFENPKGNALSADGLSCKGAVFLDQGFTAKGEVRLLGVEVGGNLSCRGGTFENPQAHALSADGLSCKGTVFLNQGFAAKGEVRLLRAKVGSILACRGGTFENPKGNALSADGLSCKGAVFLDEGFAAKGEVRLPGAKIGGDLVCSGGTFENPQAHALSADRFDCKGDVFLDEGFAAKGEVRLLGVEVGGNLDCRGGTFENPQAHALNLENAIIAGALRMAMASPPNGAVILSGVQTDALEDDRASWPETGALFLDGLRYARINPMDLETRREWLKRAPFAPQPYEQLAAVLRSHGWQEAAKLILMGQQRARIRYGSDPWYLKLWAGFLGFTIGYGYRPGRAVWGLLALWLIGGLIFGFGEAFMVKTDSDGSTFNALIYSLDTLVPIIDLHMESDWEPALINNAQEVWGVSVDLWVWWYLRVHILLGWALTTLAVLGFSGLVRGR